MRQTLLALLVLMVSSCSARFVQRPDNRLLDLQREHEKLARLTDAVDRVKCEIRISDILLSLTGDAVRDADTETVAQRLTDYVSTIQDAYETLKQSGRDPRRKASGFKELEISLRRQTRLLNDIGRALPLDQREPAEKAASEASRIREALFKGLFG